MSPIPTCVPSQVLKFPIHLHPSPSFWSFLLNFCNSFKSVHSLQEERAVGFSGRDINQNHQRSTSILPLRAPSVNGPFKVHV